MNKNKKIIIFIAIFFVICIFACMGFKYFYNVNKLPLETTDKKEEVKESIEKDKQTNEEIIDEESNFEEDEEVDDSQESIEINDSQDDIKHDNTDSTDNSPSVTIPTPIPKPSTNPTPSQIPTPSIIPDNSEDKENENSNQDEQQSQEETVKKETDLEIATKYHLADGFPITYNEEGKMVTIEECMIMGETLKEQQDTSFVYQFECPLTQYKNTSVVGLVVCFEYNGSQQCLPYDKYKLTVK